MLEKISEFSTKLDKKRVYTAVGALVVALAAGHVMQRTTAKGPELAPQQDAAATPTAAPASAPDPVPAPMVASLTGEASTPEVAAKSLSGAETDPTTVEPAAEPALELALADTGDRTLDPANTTPS